MVENVVYEYGNKHYTWEFSEEGGWREELSVTRLQNCLREVVLVIGWTEVITGFIIDTEVTYKPLGARLLPQLRLGNWKRKGS